MYNSLPWYLKLAWLEHVQDSFTSWNKTFYNPSYFPSKILPSNHDFFKLGQTFSVPPPKRKFLCCSTNAVHTKIDSCLGVKVEWLHPSVEITFALSYASISRRFDSFFNMEWDSYRYGSGQVLGQPGILEADISSTKTWELPLFSQKLHRKIWKSLNHSWLIGVFPIWWFPSPKGHRLGSFKPPGVETHVGVGLAYCRQHVTRLRFAG